MDRAMDEFTRLSAEKILAKLAKKGIGGVYLPDIPQAREHILGLIPTGASLTRGGSVSLDQSGVWEEVLSRPDLRVFDPFGPGLDRQASLQVRLDPRALGADIYLAGVNAISQEGHLVNLDATGNRIAAISFGPKKVILLAGMNKVCPSLEAAMQRVKHQAAPANAIRLKLDTPCAKTGICADCNSPQRICYQWSIIQGHAIKDRIHLVLTGQSLGY